MSHDETSAADTHDVHDHVKSYYVVFAILVILVGVTIGASMIPLGVFAAPIALSIATFKALLIILIFMHVKDETPLVQVFAFMGFFWLFFLFAFMFSDYLTRQVHRAKLPVAHSVSDQPAAEISAGH